MNINGKTKQEYQQIVDELNDSSDACLMACDQVFIMDLEEKIEKYEKALKWIAERGWNPHGTVSENSHLSYDCHCVAAEALSNE